MTLNVSLTPELEKLIKEKVKSGRYLSSSKVVREGLRLLEERDRLRVEKLDALRRDVELGIEQAERGDVAPFDPDHYRNIIKGARRKKR